MRKFCDEKTNKINSFEKMKEFDRYWIKKVIFYEWFD
jgi:hypothetical protein